MVLVLSITSRQRQTQDESTAEARRKLSEIVVKCGGSEEGSRKVYSKEKFIEQAKGLNWEYFKVFFYCSKGILKHDIVRVDLSIRKH